MLAARQPVALDTVVQKPNRKNPASAALLDDATGADRQCQETRRPTVISPQCEFRSNPDEVYSIARSLLGAYSPSGSIRRTLQESTAGLAECAAAGSPAHRIVLL